MKKVVLTGGPHAGKTTVLKALQETFKDRVTLIPEAATILLEGGFANLGETVNQNDTWARVFQGAIVALQNHMEKHYEHLAEGAGSQLLICDRGIMDGVAYTPGGVAEFCARYGINELEAYNRYETIIHLESLATADPLSYGKAGNRWRHESLNHAQELEYATRLAWLGHPNRVQIKGKNIDEKVRKVVEHINSIL